MSGRRLYPAVGLAIAAAVLPAAGNAGATGSASVTLKNVAFSPARLTISKGTRVTFRWHDDGTVHNVRSVGRKRFKSIDDRAKGERSVRFTSAGTYRYECTLHPGMTGRITVR